MATAPAVANQEHEQAELAPMYIDPQDVINFGPEVIFVSDSDDDNGADDDVIIDDSGIQANSSEAVEDLRDSLLNDYPSDIDEAGAGPSSRGDKAQDASGAGLHTHRTFEVDVAEDDDDFFYKGLSHAEVKIAKRLAKIFDSPKGVNAGRLNTLTNSPLILAKSLTYVKKSRAQFRKNINDVINHFASRWNEREKKQFFNVATDTSDVHRPAKLIDLLELDDFPLISLLSAHYKIVINILRRLPAKAAPLLDLLASFLGKSNKEKLAQFRALDCSSARARWFLEAVSDTTITTLANLVSHTFRIERPAPFRMAQLPSCLTHLNHKVNKGMLEFGTAVDIINHCVAGKHADALDILTPFPLFRDYFSAKWARERDNTKPPPPLPPPLPSQCDDNDRFHSAPIKVIKILTVDMASQIVKRLSAVKELFVVARTGNDYRFDPDALGAVGFTAAHWDEGYFLFPVTYPAPTKLVSDAVKKLTLKCMDTKRMKVLMGEEYKFANMINMEGACTAEYRRLFTLWNVAHCPKFFANSFVCPYARGNDKALFHAAAELFHMSRSSNRPAI